jgi:predicted transcriptional regulator
VQVTITRAQRDAIYELVVDHLSGIGDVWTAMQDGDFASAKRFGRAFAEDLRLLEDLGWAESLDRESVTLTMLSDELTRTLARLHRTAAGSLGSYVSRPKDDEQLAQRDLAASAVLGEILSEAAVAKALASRRDLTRAEIASATGLGRSTVGKALAALERTGAACRRPGGRAAGRRLPDRWSSVPGDKRSRSDSSNRRLRPGQLDQLVLDYINRHAADEPIGVTALATALERSAGAVGNCLARLAAANQVRQASMTPRRYTTAAPQSGKRGPTRRVQKEQS